MAGSFIGPLFYFVIGAALVAFGLSRWLGLWKSWYTTPGVRERRLQLIFGKSPLPFVLFGFPLLLIDIALIGLLVNPFVSLTLAIIAVMCVVAGLVVLVARPNWSLPPWVKSRSNQ